MIQSTALALALAFALAQIGARLSRNQAGRR